MLGSVPHLSCALVVPVGLCAPPPTLPVAHLFSLSMPWLSAVHLYTGGPRLRLCFSDYTSLPLYAVYSFRLSAIS